MRLGCVVFIGEEIAAIPVLEIEECAFSVAFEVLAFEVVHPIHPLAVEGNLGLRVEMAGMGHFAGHGALELVDYKVWLKLFLRLWFADRH